MNNTGWLVNDCLTCIPGTKTFWHDLLENIPNLIDKKTCINKWKNIIDNIVGKNVTTS